MTNDGARPTPADICDELGHHPGLAWSIAHCAQMLGVAPATLRTWENRYGLGPSQRSEGGHRRYTCEDVDRLELMRRLLAVGVSASVAATHARDHAIEEVHAEARKVEEGGAASLLS